jgi:hypothetical protein
MNNSSGSPWIYVVGVVFVVIILSAFSATKKIAYWIGAIALILILLPAWRSAGYPIWGQNK